ncbi:hypothetical protein [Azospirillum palustre]
MLEYLPPRISREVTIGGYAVPMVEAKESADGLECHICLDGRFGAIIPAGHAQSVIGLLAHALAIGAGYSCHGANSVSVNPHRVKVTEVEAIATGGAHG